MKLKEFFSVVDIPWDGKILAAFVHAGDVGMAARRLGAGRERRDYGRGILLYHLIKKFESSRVLEIGTGRGYGTYCMARALSKSLDARSLLTVDIVSANKMYDFTMYPEGAVLSCVKLIHYENLPKRCLDKISYRLGRSSAALRRLNGKFDFAFVDGSHKRKDVKKDIDNCLKLLRSEGILCLHDYKNARTPEVTEAVDSRLTKLQKRFSLFEVVTEGYSDEDRTYKCIDTESCILVCLPKGICDGI